MARGTASEKTFRLERDLESACDRLAKRKGAFVRKYKGPGRRSHPDKLYALNGPWWVEFKRSGEVPTELQWLEICAMHKAGLEVYWTDSYEEFEEILAAHERPTWFD